MMSVLDWILLQASSVNSFVRKQFSLKKVLRTLANEEGSKISS